MSWTLMIEKWECINKNKTMGLFEDEIVHLFIEKVKSFDFAYLNSFYL